jgi:iron complex transport system ATP-binding protein
VSVSGRPIGDLSRAAVAALMGVVPQYTSVAFAFTVLQTVVMARAAGLSAMGRPSRKDYRDAEAVLDDLGVAHLKARIFNALSGGERQIVLIARAIFQRPSILLKVYLHGLHNL